MKKNRLVDGVIVGDVIGRYEAGQKFRPIETIEFVDQRISDRWQIRIPRFLAEYHGWWDTWEKERHNSMFEHLKTGMLFYEIGASDGWQAAFYASMVGGSSSMVLVEPTVELWPNIKTIWENNNLSLPRATYLGFCGDHDTETSAVNFSAWPQKPDYSQFLKGRSFSYLSNSEKMPCHKIDTLAAEIGIPDALNIDVEGAELLVLRGAEQTLRKHRPLVWVSVHWEFIKNFGHTPEMLYEFMASCGYKGVLLATDHEEHHFFTAEPS